MTGEVKGLALLGLAVFCPSALALAGVGYIAGKVTGAEYRDAVRDANRILGKRYGGGREAEMAAEATASYGEALAPWTFGITAVWMGYNAHRIRKKAEEAMSSARSCEAKRNISVERGPMQRTYSTQQF